MDAVPYNTDINDCIIATPTASHYKDLKIVLDRTNCTNILIEKPIEIDKYKGKKISELAQRKNINVRVSYNMRFLNIFDRINYIIKNEIENIRIIKISCGQYLPDWRPQIDYRKIAARSPLP